MRVSATISTGTIFASQCFLHIHVLISPFPISIVIPVAAVVLSTQPGYGSFQAGDTVIIEKIMNCSYQK